MIRARLERVVHTLGHSAYGTFGPYGDWSCLTSACWLSAFTKKDIFIRFSVVVASNRGSEVGRDIHGFAISIIANAAIMTWLATICHHSSSTTEQILAP